MWRKIHSNRDPRDTLLAELNREFKPRLNHARNGIMRLLSAKPNLFFGLMVAMLCTSAVLSFSLPPQHDQPPTQVKKNPDPLIDGFGQIMQVAGSLRETIHLKQTVDSLTSLPKLSGADSIRLERALDRLRDLELTKNNHHDNQF